MSFMSCANSLVPFPRVSSYEYASESGRTKADTFINALERLSCVVCREKKYANNRFFYVL